MRSVILISMMFIALALLPVVASGGGTSSEGCGTNCASCHSLTKEEAIELLRNSSVAPADAKVEEISVMETVGLWKVTLDTEGEKPFFIDFGKQNVFIGEFYPLRRPILETPRADWVNGE